MRISPPSHSGGLPQGGEVGNGVCVVLLVEHVVVGPVAAGHEVVAVAGDDPVVTLEAEDLVIAVRARQFIGAVSALDSRSVDPCPSRGEPVG
jgi:hypothetical protein